MTDHVDGAGDRVEELLATLRSGEDREVAEELVRVLMNLYGEGLARIVAVLREHDTTVLGAIAADELVASLLMLHDLHPDDADSRIRRALVPFGTVEYLGVDDNGVARLRLRGGCRAGTRVVVEQAVLDAAPEVVSVEITTATPLLQIGMEPPPGWSVAS
ncbi:MAG TPA: NifU family protein [Lentzea sp.]